MQEMQKMRKMIMLLLMVAAVAISGCAQMEGDDDQAPVQPPADLAAADQVNNETVNITSGNMTYPAYLAAPAKRANGLEW